MPGEYFDFNKYFTSFENNPSIQNSIEKILSSITPGIIFEWITDKNLQKKGVDLITEDKDNSKKKFFDLKGVSNAHNHHYLEDISIEIVSIYEKYKETRGNKGRSWLFKEKSETTELLYFWLDENNNVLPEVVIIEFKALKEWANYFFNIYELYPFLVSKKIASQIKNQARKTEYLGDFKGFSVFSANNKNYHTINVKMELGFLNNLFSQFKLGQIYKLKELVPEESTHAHEPVLWDFL